MGDAIFNSMEIDMLGEILNISLGASATSASNMLSRRVEITTPEVEVVSKENFQYDSLEPAIGVGVDYVEGIKGKNVMIFKRMDIKAIVEILMGGIEIPDDEFELNEMNISAVRELMNQMMGGAATSISEFLGCTIDITPPTSFEITDRDFIKTEYFPDAENLVLIGFDFKIQDAINTKFLSVMTVELAREIISRFDMLSAGSPNEDIDINEQIEKGWKDSETKSVQEETVVEKQVEKEPQKEVKAEIKEEPKEKPKEEPKEVKKEVQQVSKPKTKPKLKRESGAAKLIEVKTPQYEDFQLGNGADDREATNYDLIMDVPLQVSVELGRTVKQVKDIMEFTEGTLVVLDKLVGEFADLYVNGQLIAKGDVVVIDDSFGFRVSEIIREEETE